MSEGKRRVWVEVRRTFGTEPGDTFIRETRAFEGTAEEVAEAIERLERQYGKNMVKVIDGEYTDEEI
jgi:hypothetical protein